VSRSPGSLGRTSPTSSGRETRCRSDRPVEAVGEAADRAVLLPDLQPAHVFQSVCADDRRVTG
jgi:hypothetical protein